MGYDIDDVAFSTTKKYFYGHKCMVYRILSLSLIYASLNLPPHYHLVCDLEKRSVLCSIFFLSSWHYDPHYYYYYYSMNAIVFFSTAILLYFFKLSSITIILHCIACCITICI